MVSTTVARQRHASDDQRRQDDRSSRQDGPLAIAGGVLGFGLGGLIDVVVFHLLLQWHHLVSGLVDPTTVEGLRTNLRADGLLAGTMLLVVLAGIGLLWRVGRLRGASWSGSTLAGSMLVGWGAFNVLDELLNHRVLGAHHVRPGPNQLLWDAGFALGTLLLLAIGAWLIRR